jgi:hypothetical protein
MIVVRAAEFAVGLHVPPARPAITEHDGSGGQPGHDLQPRS